ncbi:AAA family ATPase [Desulfobacterales bacterium HSG16]|nr:AAA family ATPase [Desulfobacterales bacterium HSG16]
MKIKQIRIKNFLGIEELDLKFQHPNGKPLDMIVLAGPNGCGKTSVLEACILVLGQDRVLPNPKEELQYIHKGTSRFEISAVFIHDDKAYNIKRTAMNQDVADANTTSVIDAIQMEYFSSWRYPKLTKNVFPSIGNEEESPDTEKNRLYRIKQYLINLKASKAFEDDQTAHPQEKDAYETMNELWKDFYPSGNERFIARKVSEDISQGFDIFLDGRKQEPIPLDSLSSGEIEVFTLIGQRIIKPFSNGIVFIDEPELHLHSSWHRVILRALRKILPGTQIICATHSQEILDSVYSYERFTLLSENDPRIRLNKSMEFAKETDSGGWLAGR